MLPENFKSGIEHYNKYNMAQNNSSRDIFSLIDLYKSIYPECSMQWEEAAVFILETLDFYNPSVSIKENIACYYLLKEKHYENC